MSSTPPIQFYFDLASPYSYLAATQVDALGARLGAEVRWRPVSLGGIFKLTGNVPPAMLQARGRYMLQDLERWARVYGVPFVMPDVFPSNSLLAQRLLLAVQVAHGEPVMRDLALRVYALYWAHNRDVADPDTLRDALVALELDADAALAAAVTPDNKKALIDTTAELVERGAFGLPVCFVGEQMFFGNDRLTLLEATYPDGTPSARLIAPMTE